MHDMTAKRAAVTPVGQHPSFEKHRARFPTAAWLRSHPAEKTITAMETKNSANDDWRDMTGLSLQKHFRSEAVRYRK